ncbi:MAG: FAD-binding protein [SAR202 cluster bacterium]|nr:FAD-binding protein [SAR202 cluster bacterium]
MHKTIEAGVLIIGGGGSGCRAAIEAHDQGADVLMIVKGRLGNSGCTLNVGTSAAVGEWGDPNDTPFSAMEDLLEHGGYLGVQDLAKVLAEEAPDRVREMDAWGIDFERNEDGSIAVDEDAAHSFARNLIFKPAKPSHHDYGSSPGMAMMDVLMEQMEARNIRVMNDVVLVDLLTNDGRLVGATAIDCNSNEFVVIKASATILATGTYSQIYSLTTVSEQETGDGQAAAFRAGAELMDMENTQFVPTSVGYPPGSIFLNAKGERFLEKYGVDNPHVQTKETLTFAVGMELKEGRGTERGTILIDMTNLTNDKRWAARREEFTKSLQESGSPYPGFKAESIDLAARPFETGPLAHTATGGIRINTQCETTLPGLYAAGAVAGGVYGHARPQGFTSMITVVFGRRAGLFASQRAKDTGEVTLDEAAVEASFQRATGLAEALAGVKPREVKAQIKDIMTASAWVIKDEETLNDGLNQILEIGEIERQRAKDSTFKSSPRNGFEWAEALEIPNLLISSELMLRGGIARKESRGAFFRSDFPNTDDEKWMKNIIYKQVDGETVLETVPVNLKYCGPGTKSHATA